MAVQVHRRNRLNPADDTNQKENHSAKNVRTKSSARAISVRSPTPLSLIRGLGGGHHVLQVCQRCCDILEPQNGCPPITAGYSDHKYTSHNHDLLSPHKRYWSGTIDLFASAVAHSENLFVFGVNLFAWSFIRCCALGRGALHRSYLSDFQAPNANDTLTNHVVVRPLHWQNVESTCFPSPKT